MVFPYVKMVKNSKKKKNYGTMVQKNMGNFTWADL